MAGESEQLIEEIIEITEYLRKFTRTVIDSETALAKAIGKETKAVEENTDAVDDNTKTVKQSTRAKKEEWQVAREAADASRRHQREIQDEIRVRSRGKSTIREMMDEFGRGTTTSAVLRNEFEKLVENKTKYGYAVTIAGEALAGLSKATVQMAAALYKGQRGTLVSAKAMSELTKPLTEMGSIIGAVLTGLSFVVPALRGLRLLGLGLSAAAAALGLTNKYNELAAEQTDKLFKSFNELSKSGINLTGGLGQVFEMAQTLGLSVAELEEFNRLLTSNTQSLALFGGTAAKGAERFAGAAGTLVKEFGRELELMGIDRAEQREIAMGYMTIQARTGQIMNKSINQLAVESAKYIKELDMLAEITGSTRKQQQEAREAALAETRFRAARVEAERRGDTEQMRRLDIAQRAAGVARAAGDVRGFTGILQAAAGRGALTTPEAIAAEQTYRISEILRQPNITDVEIAQHMGKSVELQQGNLAGITALIGNIDLLQTDFVKSADLQKQQLALAKAAEEAGFRGPTGVQDFLRTEAGKRMMATPEMQAVVTAGRQQQNAALMMDSGVRTFNGAAQLSLQASKVFADAVSAMPGAKVVGGGYSTGGAAGGGGRRLGGGAVGVAGLAGAAAKNLNPGNLRFAGQAGATMGTGGFAKFGTVDEGLVALANQLNLYLTGKSASGQRDTLASLISVYAPPSENQTRDYIEKVSRFMGINPDDKIGRDPATMAKLMTAIIGMENFGDPSKGYNFRSGVQTAVAQSLGVDPSKIGKFARGGIASGPTSGYIAQLHGTEAVIPMPNGQSIKVDMPDFSSGMSQQVQAMSAQITRLDELVSLMRNQNNISSKILQVSQA